VSPEPEPKVYLGGKLIPMPTPIGFGFFHPNPKPVAKKAKNTTTLKFHQGLSIKLKLRSTIETQAFQQH
jgi:hypothetical protein